MVIQHWCDKVEVIDVEFEVEASVLGVQDGTFDVDFGV